MLAASSVDDLSFFEIDSFAEWHCAEVFANEAQLKCQEVHSGRFDGTHY